MKYRVQIVRVGIVSLMAAGSAMAADQASSQPGSQTTTSTVLSDVKVKELNQEPEKYSGAEVMLKGNVVRVEGPGAFILDGPGLFNDKILVVVDKNAAASVATDQPQAGQPAITTTAPLTFKEGDKLQVQGKVEEIGISRIEKMWGPLKTEIKAEFQGTMPVLLVPPSGIKPASS